MKNVLYYAECVRYALREKRLQADDFENSDLRVYHRRIANPQTVFKALGKGGIIIPVVDGQLLNSSRGPVATVLLSANSVRDEVKYYNPVSCQQRTCSIDTFIDAWKHGGGECVTAFSNDGTYQPRLLDLTHVELPDSLNELMEAMAENAHDRWALERQSEGWTYGIKRDDNRLETPDMVPYAQLTDSEKEYDRIMAAETLKLLVSLGYKIVK